MALSYLALGDSYTIGEAVAVEGRWPHQLAAALRAQGIDLADPQTIATTGWTTDELDAGIDAASPQGPFGLVSLLIGVNNQYRERPLDEYRAQFQALLQRATGFAAGRAGRVLVLSFPDWGVTPYGAGSGRDLARVARETDAFNAAAEEISARHGAAFVDITGLSRDCGADPAMIAADGLHPSAQQYARWSAQALPVAARLLAAAD
ncbi:SGNH/GDSL hydrolase family protein [Stenotrophomonas maltophilia]|uniref:SGNH/GDSL hydrolase family protein n=1 Tax=Stenotrophomonas maltophilia TaxID=40324 RepID=UPI0034DB3350